MIFTNFQDYWNKTLVLYILKKIYIAIATGQNRDLDFLRTKFHPFYEGENGRYSWWI